MARRRGSTPGGVKDTRTKANLALMVVYKATGRERNRHDIETPTRRNRRVLGHFNLASLGVRRKRKRRSRRRVAFFERRLRRGRW